MGIIVHTLRNYNSENQRGTDLAEWDNSLNRGLVIKTQSGFFTVQTEVDKVVCQIVGRLKEVKEDSPFTTDIVALGDYVHIERQADGSGTIVEVEERQHTLSRVATSSAVGTSAENEQIIITNCDQAIFVFAAEQPKPQPRMLDRLLVAAEKAQIESIVICVNKIDIASMEETRSLFQVYEDIGYLVLYTSTETQQGLDVLKKTLQGKVSVFTGPSGVGKSSLMNSVYPGLKLRTAHVSDFHHKGRHTTRFSQLIPLEGGGYVADTPGIRSLAPWDVEPDELDSYFREFRAYVPDCQFADCMHIHEPKCAVRKALAEGKISATRYDSYLRLREELEEQYVYL
jgi:ribosome biogenesis GTPase / thiamine phosphate phosphatase